jgi:Ran GTPase-activating protein (RanGAP) involved in mRNA processing and transport
MTAPIEIEEPSAHGYEERIFPMYRLTAGTRDRIANNDPNISGLIVDVPTNIHPTWAQDTGAIIMHNTQLRKLEFSIDDDRHNEISRLLPCFCQLIHNRSIEHFCLAGAIDHSRLDIFQVLAPFFESNNRILRIIEITGSILMHTRIRSLISNVIGRNNSFRRINLMGNGIGDEPMRDVLKALNRNRGLHNLLDLKLGYNFMGDESCKALGNLLRNQACNIRKLGLNGNHFGSAGIEILVDALVHNNTIKHLNLCDSESKDPIQFWCTFSNYLSNDACSLEILDIGENEIDDESAIDLGYAFVVNKSLKRLKFDTTALTPIGWRACSKLLKSTSSNLLDLDIRFADMDDEDAFAIATALVDNQSLEVLNMEACSYITATGWLACFQVLLDSPTKFSLKSLHLGNNSICNAGALMLVDLISTNMSQLANLNIDESDLTADGLIAFNGALINVVCDLSSVDTIHSSNHSLSCLGNMNPPLALHKLLTLNKNDDNGDVSRQKILLHSFTDDHSVGRFFSHFPPQLLPEAIAWIGRDRSGFSTMNSLLRSMPYICTHETKVNVRASRTLSGRPRKLRKVNE